MTALLEIRDLNIAFSNGGELARCADRVSFTVAPHEIVALVGESGCGKSITAMSILGLLGRQGKVTGGQILFEGRDLLACSERELDEIRGKEIAMVFQDIMYSLNPVFTVETQLTEGIRKHTGCGKKAARETALELLGKTGVPARAMRAYPHQLSGGMRQRVMIAMALALRPKLLIADEPTTALDVTIQLQIMELLKQLREEYGMAILLITHDLGIVAETADRAVVMYAGQCLEQTDVETLLTHPAHPYTQALLQAVPGIRADRAQRLFSIPGAVPERYYDMEGCRFQPRCPYGARCSGQAEDVLCGPGHTARCVRAREGGVSRNG